MNALKADDFAIISKIEVKKETTWKPKVFLTFDIDWAHDEVLLDTIELVEKAGVAATWFVTHETPLLARLRSNPQFELGIHPNFNALLNGQPTQGKTAKEVIERLLEIVPEAISVRSHCMTQSTPLLQLFTDYQLTHDCNHFIPEQANIPMKPWRLWTGLTKVPYFWEDDVACLYETNTPLDQLTQQKSLKVFDFHPIHVFLNTEKLARYEQTRTIHQRPEALREKRYTGEGARTLLTQLIGLS